MRTPTPSPSDLLNQLAEDVLRQIDAGSRHRFEKSCAALTDYHRFLLEAYATVDPSEGGIESYALLSDAWRANYQQWQSVYFDIMERAISRIPDDPEFTLNLAYLPLRLLPRGTDYGATQPTLDILGLETTLFYRLEDWRRRKLAGADKLPHAAEAGFERVITTIASAWESTQSVVPGRDAAEEAASPEKKWKALEKLWPYYFRHLHTAAELLLIAVWDKDALAEKWFRDLLLRWRSNLYFGDVYDYELYWRPFVNADLLALPWDKVVDRLDKTRFYQLSPEGVFRRILTNMHDDVLLLTKAMMLQWIQRGVAGEFAGESAARLERREILQPDTGIYEHGLAAEPKDSLLDVIEILLSGSHFDKSYGAALDSLVMTLDRLSERSVQSGRTFTPSTAHDREALLGGLMALVLAGDSPTRSQTVKEAVTPIIADEQQLPRGDKTLVDLTRIVDQLLATLTPDNATLEAAARLLNANLQFEEALATTRTVLTWLKSEMGRLRDERIRKREWDLSKVERLQTEIDEDVVTGGEIVLFEDFKVRTVARAEQDGRWRIRVIKENYVIPEMGYPSKDFYKQEAKAIARRIADSSFFEFADLPRTRIERPDGPEDVSFWLFVRDAAAALGESPAIMLRTQDVGRFSRAFVYGRPSAELRVERPQNRDQRRAPLIATVEGVKVFHLDYAKADALMFSTKALEEFRVEKVAGDHLATLSWTDVEDDPWQALITADFRTEMTWRYTGVIELALRTEAAAVGETEA